LAVLKNEPSKDRRSPSVGRVANEKPTKDRRPSVGRVEKEKPTKDRRSSLLAVLKKKSQQKTGAEKKDMSRMADVRKSRIFVMNIVT